MIKVPPNNACSNNWYHHRIGWSSTFSKPSSSSCYKWGRWGWCLISFLHAWKVMFHCGSEEEIKRIEKILHFWHFEPSKRMGKCNAYHNTNPFVLDFICYSPHTFTNLFHFSVLRLTMQFRRNLDVRGFLIVILLAIHALLARIQQFQ